MGTAAVETTPVAPQAPQAPQAPAVPASPQDLAPGVSAMIDKITQRAGQTREGTAAELRMEAPGDPTATMPDAAPVGELGVQTPVEGAEVPSVADTPAEAGPPAMVAEIKSDEPEGEVVLRARDPNTGQFSEMDQTRTYELSIRDKETGETRVYNKTLPDLMRLAKDGIAMQKSRDELVTYRNAVPQMQQQIETVRSEAEGLRALALELLTAPDDVVIARREAYLAEQTPEKVFARREQELAAREQRLRQDEVSRQQAAQSQVASALATRIGPVMQEVEGLVGKQAAAGQLMIATMPLMVNGRVPLENLPQLEAYVTGPYREWAKAEAAKRTTQTADIERQRAATAETQRQAQLAARQAGVASRPVGGLAGTTAPPQAKPKNVEDAISRIISGGARSA